MTPVNMGASKTSLNKSHFSSNPLEISVQELKDKVIARGDLPHISVRSQLELIDELCTFPFGRFIVEHKGANGAWTDFLISFPHVRKASGLAVEDRHLTPLEDFILRRSPIALAHRERFKIFQTLLQQQLKNGITLASVPCGLMQDLITLDFSALSSFRLVGLDIDQESLNLAQQSAQHHRIADAQLIHQDAWQMNFHHAFDVITSSGLNVYESDRSKVVDLYRRFFAALKPGGVLIISVLTYPPGESQPTDWDLNGIPPQDLHLERALYHDILNLHWRNFRTARELDADFKEAGFSDVAVHFDRHRIFPTIVATRRA